MSSKVICPSCGHASEDPVWCDECGAALDGADAPSSASSREWLDIGDELEVRCDREALGLEPEGMITLRARVERVDEVSTARHIFAASLVDPPEPALRARGIVLEELGAMLAQQSPHQPEALLPWLRCPIGHGERAGHRVHVYPDDGQVSLDDVMQRAQGRLELEQLEQIFLALLDTVEALHAQGYLYLRLSPWTLRVDLPPAALDALEPVEEGGALPDGLAAEVTIVEGARSKRATPEASASAEEGLGVEHTLSGVGVDDDAVAASVARADAEVERGRAEHQTLPGGLGVSLSLDTDPEDAAEAASDSEARPLRAKCDGSFGLYRIGEELREVPVVMSFSAPEMFGRARAEIGPACDVFSLGMVLYFLVCGDVPPTSIYTRHTPALPARNFRPDFPVGLHGVIARATRPDPRERFSEVASLRDAFKRAVATARQRLQAPYSPHKPVMNFCVDRHIGVAKRRRNPVNQDQVFGAMSDDNQFALIVIADGVSTASYGSGDLASKCLSDAAARIWDEVLPDYLIDQEVDAVEVIHRLLEDANDHIVAYINANHTPFHGNPHEVMGSTGLVAVIHSGVVTLGALGDSRVYLQRGHNLEQLTIDHNLWTLSVLDGVSADSALALPHGDALARCLGTFYVEQQRLVAVPPQPDVFRFPVMAGDTLLLTTDGLVDFAGSNQLMAEDNILSILLAEQNPDLACLELILLANRGGGGDNIGLGVVKFV